MWHMATSHRTTDFPKLLEEPQCGTLSDAPAASTGTFPPRSLGEAQPDATAALCQPKHLAGVRGWAGNMP